MDKFEQVCRRMFSQPNWAWKCLIGGILMIFPVINFFAFGYLSRVASDARRGIPMSLPEWEDWGNLFVEGLYFFIIFSLFTLLPLCVAYLLSLLPFIGILGPLAYIPFIPVVLVAPSLTAAGLYRFQTGGSLREVFDMERLFLMLKAHAEEMAIPTLAFLGILLAGLPLLPLAFFIGLALLFHFYFALFQFAETRRSAGSAGPYTVL